MSGLLITFEGIDGCGKSTQAALLRDRFLKSGQTAELYREPGGTRIGEGIRSLLLDPSLSEMTPHAELFLYLAARAQITGEIIRPSLDSGNHVILDRYIDSTVVYQGFARSLGMDWMIDLNKIATDGLVPDITFLVELDPTEAVKRMDRSFDRMESEGLDFMKTVREGFLTLAGKEKERFVVLDGSKSIEEIESGILSVLENRFGLFSTSG